jgi:hypothetical protein
VQDPPHQRHTNKVQDKATNPTQTLYHNPNPHPNQTDKAQDQKRGTQCKKTETPKPSRTFFSRGVPQLCVDVEHFGNYF